MRNNDAGAKLGQDPTDAAYDATGLAVAHSLKSEEFNEQCNDLIKEGFGQAGDIQTHNFNGEVHFVQWYTKPQPGATKVSLQHPLMSNLEGVRVIHEDNRKDFNKKSAQALEDGFQITDAPQCKFTKDKMYFTVPMKKFKKSVLITNLNQDLKIN